MKKLIVATKNQGKVNEFREMFSKYGIETYSLNDLDTHIPDVEETGTTFEENAQLKAETIADLLQVPVLADDSGLEVDALNKRPGVFSARFAGEDKDDHRNLEKVLDELKSIENREARFVCALALAIPGQETIFERGTCEGMIATKSYGDRGFGYDPIFIPRGYEETFAQLPSDVKNQMSHRSRAIQQMETSIQNILT
ncbi:XTP/dITP diphosphatase [Pontibacillus yanchengensis]|uniref:XTP/dITP diphosphatase n=2 Tax=Pontibacillus yanchengensis TaxID=462910 RepID=A0ACC7VGH9_9BACI|nr:XTP/dITP diphosphatase [Pontibacillus yanchengensis]MYL34206.1 XTP/dITP diphosphatase [Pontibacillus yanchengensis]MYL53299.1 XTP/dITP diphosphatase [Pontibacillus yanchengensis]